MKRQYTEIDQVDRAVAEADKLVSPIRESLVKRFPTTSLLLVTFGASATIYGIERFIAEIAWLNDRPFLIIAVGVSVLVLTGRLYKKLG